MMHGNFWIIEINYTSKGNISNFTVNRDHSYVGAYTCRYFSAKKKYELKMISMRMV